MRPSKLSLVEMFEKLDGNADIATLVESRETHDDQLRTARMLCLLEACDLARPA